MVSQLSRVILKGGGMDTFLEDLAQASPNPGGGAAAAFGARLGLALLEKVVRLEGQRSGNPPGSRRRGWDEALAHLTRLAASLAHLQEEDVRAYLELAAARAAHDGPRLTAAVGEAVACPAEIARQAAEALELLAWAGERCRPHLVADLLVGCEFLGAALRGAHHIAAANLALATAAAARQDLVRKLGESRPGAEDLYRRVLGSLLARGQSPVGVLPDRGSLPGDGG